MMTERKINNKNITFIGSETMLEKTVEDYCKRHSKHVPRENEIGYFRHDITIQK